MPRNLYLISKDIVHMVPCKHSADITIGREKSQSILGECVSQSFSQPASVPGRERQID